MSEHRNTGTDHSPPFPACFPHTAAVKMDANEPEPGDLIEFSCGVYKHWAVYIGDGDVVHLVTPDISSSAASSTVSGGSVRGQVKKNKLKDVINGKDWKINNLHDHKWKPRPKQKIVKDAVLWVGEAVEYSVTDRNCEHIATLCRYGKPESRQAERLKIAGAGFVMAVIVGALFHVFKKHLT
ncbi:phospholipase A and acyltransferase 4-like [Thunnus maccoyii]|uniref:phospholipase A and acyltransferase 4-like n=1 Tax=Thunnus maccoyii TaxID=8240 RepID=UPI001C4B7653|nr:phospholipase A and acyltransferase 4-like [Thunnus maccoyii]